MEYIIALIEGIATFISPCLLPMLPLYLCYFVGESKEKNSRTVVFYATGFVIGFSVIFTILGAFAATIGSLLLQYQKGISIAGGIIVILFGLNFTGWLSLPFINRQSQKSIQPVTSFLSSVLFGIVFALNWTPCVSAFLGSILLLASQQASLFKGILLLFIYSLGLGIPFILSAYLIEQLKDTFTWIKNHYQIITKLSGIFLIIMGVLMMTGLFYRITDLLI